MPLTNAAPQAATLVVCPSGSAVGRKRRINVPGWVGALRWLRPALSTPLGERPIRSLVASLLPRMDSEVADLGRSTTSRSEHLEGR